MGNGAEGEAGSRRTEGVEFYRHSLGADEKGAVARVLDSLFLTTGEEVYAFEREFAEYLGAPDVVAVSSCTAAEQLAFLALGLRPGDEVITTPLTFIATATAILHAGGVPVFVDVEPSTGNLDPERVEAAITSRTRAIAPVHLYGTMCDMVALRELADRFGLLLVEDAAHCVEGERNGVRPAGLGDAACFSFYATKTLTSGEGGAVAVRDPAVAERLRTLRLHGMSKSAADRYHGLYQHWDMIELGWKFNMSNIQGAMLRPQLGRLGDRLRRREEIARKYDAAIDALDGVDRPVVPPATRPARHLYTIWVEPDRRDSYLSYLGRNGVGTAVNYRAIHELRWLRENIKVEHDLANAETIGARTLSLPLYDGLRDDEASRVCDVVAAAAREA